MKCPKCNREIDIRVVKGNEISHCCNCNIDVGSHKIDEEILRRFWNSSEQKTSIDPKIKIRI